MNLRKMKAEHYRYFTKAESLAAVNQEGHALRYVTLQTEEICLAAVNQNGHALQYVIFQTEEICLAAVNQNGHALRYVNDNCLPETKKIIIEGKEIEISSERYEALKKSLDI